VFSKEWRNVGFALKGIHHEKKRGWTIACLDEFVSSCRLWKQDPSLFGSSFFRLGLLEPGLLEPGLFLEPGFFLEREPSFKGKDGGILPIRSRARPGFALF
jgi:hypothetical protein